MNRRLLSLFMVLGSLVLTEGVQAQLPWPPRLPVLDPDSDNGHRPPRQFPAIFDESVEYPELFPSDPNPLALYARAFQWLDGGNGNEGENGSQGLSATGVIATSSKDYDKYAAHVILGLRRVEENKHSQLFFHNKTGIFSLFHPQFSPDGTRILFHEGLPPDDRHNGYLLWVWKMREGLFRPIPWLSLPPEQTVTGKIAYHDDYEAKSLRFGETLWSPGSRFVSYARGGDTLGSYQSDFGNFDSDLDTYDLWVLDVPSSQDRMVVKNAGLYWSWTYNGHLLCSRIDTNRFRLPEGRAFRPSIYDVAVDNDSTANMASKKLFDGGYYANESPDGRTIAFFDWPGALLEKVKAPDAVINNHQQGLFLFDRQTHTRTFVGAMPVKIVASAPGAPLMQWSPDGRFLYVLLLEERPDGVEYGVVYKVDALKKSLQVIARPRIGDGLNPVDGWFVAHGTSADGKVIYYDRREPFEGLKGYFNQRYTLIAIDTQSGGNRPIASLTNVVNENVDWDWYDTSGLNPACVAAAQIENKLPAWTKFDVMSAWEKEAQRKKNALSKSVVKPAARPKSSVRPRKGTGKRS